MSSAGFSCFLSLLFVSLCLLSAVSPPSLFLAAGPKFGMTKSKIWLLDVFCCSFSHTFSPSTGACQLGNARWIRPRRDVVKRSGTRTTLAVTATQDGIGGQARPAGTSSVIFVFFLLTSSIHSSSFWLPLFHRVLQYLGRAGREMTNNCSESNARQRTTVTSSVCFCFSFPLFFFSLFFPIISFYVK